MWDAFKRGISITGYKYYEAPPELKYRYPAPGSCAFDVEDHPNLYKNDWKTPFRQSDYNIAKIEFTYSDDDPRQARNYVAYIPEFDGEGKRKKYDKAMLLEQQPPIKSKVLYGDLDLKSDEARNLLWADFDAREKEMALMREEFGQIGRAHV